MAAGQPVPAVQEERPGKCAPQPDGAVPAGAGRAVPAPAAEAHPAGHLPDRVFDELFASLPSNRDRALIAFWVSTGARAAELLGVTSASMAPGSQLVTVIRKGSRAMQPLRRRRTRSCG